MVVTLGTAYADAHECFTGQGGQFIHDQFPMHLNVPLVVFVDAVSQISGSNKNIWIMRRHFISRQLLLDKGIIWFVFVDGIDDIITVGPGMRPEGILTVTIRLSPTGDIQPMLPPSFTVMRTVQEFFDEVLPGLWIRIMTESLNSSGGWRKADEIIINPSNKLAALGLRAWMQSF